MIYYSVIKRNEVLIYAVTWMNLASIKLSKKPPGSKGWILHDFIYLKCPEHTHPQRKINDRRNGEIQSEYLMIKSSFWGDGHHFKAMLGNSDPVSKFKRRAGYVAQ